MVKVGYDPHYGARPLKRAIQKELETPIGPQDSRRRHREGDKIEVGFDENRGELTFAVADRLASVS